MFFSVHALLLPFIFLILVLINSIVLMNHIKEAISTDGDSWPGWQSEFGRMIKIYTWTVAAFVMFEFSNGRLIKNPKGDSVYGLKSPQNELLVFETGVVGSVVDTEKNRHIIPLSAIPDSLQCDGNKVVFTEVKIFDERERMVVHGKPCEP